MKASFHRAASAFREKSYSKATSLLNSQGFRPAGKHDKAKAKAEASLILDQTLAKPGESAGTAPGIAETKDNKEAAPAAKEKKAGNKQS
jgi:hypothetical protein